MGEAIKTRRGKAKDSKLLLYKEGDEYIDNSGGWFAIREGANGSAASCTKTATSLALQTVKDFNGQYAQFYTADKIDLTRFKTLKIRATLSTNSNLVFHFGVNTLQSYVSGTKPAFSLITVAGTDQTYSLDITSITSTDFIMLMATGGLQGELRYQCTAYIYEVWLEE